MKTNAKTISRLLFTASAAVLCAFPVPTHAAFVITLQEVGSDVIANGSGTINTSALTQQNVAFAGGNIVPSASFISFGNSNINFLSGSFTGPSNFGIGGQLDATSTSGNSVVSVWPSQHVLGVPVGYVSGAALSDTATWANQTFSSLGITPGTYTWNWGTGPTADSLTLNAPVVPEPASVILLLGGGALLVFRRPRSTATV